MPCCFRWESADCVGAAVLSTKGIVSLISISRPPPLFLWRSSRTAAHPGVFSSLVLLTSFVSRMAAMLTLLLWRKVSSSVILSLIPFTFYCIRRRQWVLRPLQGSFWYRRHTDAEVRAAVPASTAPPPKRRFDELRKFRGFVCQLCPWVIRLRRGNFHSDLNNNIATVFKKYVKHRNKCLIYSYAYTSTKYISVLDKRKWKIIIFSFCYYDFDYEMYPQHLILAEPEFLTSISNDAL